MAMLGDRKMASLAWRQQERDISTYLPPLPMSTTSNNKDTVWVNKQYSPTDERSLAPVPRHKALYESEVRLLQCPEAHWIPPTMSVSPWSWSREHEQRTHYTSQPSTRCEEWSTLRQMLPSRGNHTPPMPPNWGSGTVQPPTRSTQVKANFPHFNSPMTRYVDQMHGTNRLFTLY